MHLARPSFSAPSFATRAFSGVPNRRDQIRIGELTPGFSGAQKRVELLCNPCVLKGPRKRGTNMAHVRPVEKSP